MKLYAACLASYNSGILHGAWIDASSDVDAMQDAINTMLRASPCPNVTVTHDGAEVPSAEEYAIHDYDDFPNMGEYPALSDVAAYVELVEDHSEIDEGDLKAIMDDFKTVADASEALADKFAGIYDTFRDYADEVADETLAAHDIKDDSPLARYFDYEAFARDLAFDMNVIDCPSGVAVFYA